MEERKEIMFAREREEKGKVSQKRKDKVQWTEENGSGEKREAVLVN